MVSDQEKRARIHSAVSVFIDAALRNRDSMFTPGRPIWGETAVTQLHQHFVQNPDESDSNFEEKFQRQLAGASPETYQLAAEMMYVHVLPVGTGNLRPKTKRRLVQTVLRWSPSPVEIPEALDEALEGGLAGTGTFFLINRPYQLTFLIEFIRSWWSLEQRQRERLLSAPWEFKKFAFAVPAINAAPQREILLHLVHPKYFENIFSIAHKKQIVQTFTPKLEEAGQKPEEDRDRRILQIRELLQAQHSGDEGPAFENFYQPWVKQQWNPKAGPSTKVDGDIDLDEEVENAAAAAGTDEDGAAEAEGGGAAAADAIRADEVGRLLLERLNVVLYGPPGTGKTYRTMKLASLWRKWAGSEAVFQVTFHPSYAYEDFIEGYRPGDDGAFQLRSGIFVNACEAAAKEPDRPVLLLIDEINRGDTARLLGELVTLLERDKRLPEVYRTLPYSRKRLWVPPNLHVLATMNTADRSVSLMDVAVRRRFAFVELAPDPELFVEDKGYFPQINGIDLSKLLVALNDRLHAVGVERDRAVGHSHLLIKTDRPNPLRTLIDRLRYDILPLVEEYCYADRASIRRVLGHLVDPQGRPNRHVFDSPEQFSVAVQELTKQVGGGSAHEADPAMEGLDASGT